MGSPSLVLISLSLFAPTALLLHVVFSPPLCSVSEDLWKVGRAVTSSCHEYTVQMTACG